jgi:hypothetical protein
VFVPFLHACAEHYTELLARFERYDAADVTARVLTQQLAAPLWRAGAGAPSGGALAHVFVDEVQDLTQAELLLLLQAVPSPRALFLAGDTAQTVSGTDFRFQDVKTQLFDEAAARRGAGTDANGATVPPPLPPPRLRALVTNYRSHEGIVGASAAVAGLIHRLFPNAIDHLPLEHGFFSRARARCSSRRRARPTSCASSWCARTRAHALRMQHARTSIAHATSPGSVALRAIHPSMHACIITRMRTRRMRAKASLLISAPTK